MSASLSLSTTKKEDTEAPPHKETHYTIRQLHTLSNRVWLYCGVTDVEAQIVTNYVCPVPLLIVAVEGNISAGKSSVCRHMNGKRIGQLKVQSHMETICSKLLELFYGDLQRYAFTIQLNTMQRRLLTITPYVSSCNSPFRDLTLLDRGPIGDLIFLLKNYLSGFILPAEVEVYRHETRLLGLREFIADKKMTAIWYLHSTPQICRANVSKRADVDSDVKEDYLNELDDLYFYAIMHIAMDDLCPVYVNDWRTFGPIEDTTRTVYDSLVDDPIPVSPDRTVVPTLSHHKRVRACFDVAAVVGVGVGSGVVAAVGGAGGGAGAGATDKESDPHHVRIPYDDAADVEPLPAASLPCLPPLFRYRHRQAWKNRVMEAWSAGKVIHFYSTRPAAPCCSACTSSTTTAVIPDTQVPRSTSPPFTLIDGVTTTPEEHENGAQSTPVVLLQRVTSHPHASVDGQWVWTRDAYTPVRTMLDLFYNLPQILKLITPAPPATPKTPSSLSTSPLASGQHTVSPK